jgi:hypothetical protein
MAPKDYGLFGDFRLVIDKAAGYFNATKLCVEGGQECGGIFFYTQFGRIKDYLKNLNL